MVERAVEAVMVELLSLTDFQQTAVVVGVPTTRPQPLEVQVVVLVIPAIATTEPGLRRPETETDHLGVAQQTPDINFSTLEVAEVPEVQGRLAVINPHLERVA